MSLSLHDPCVACATTAAEIRRAVRAFMSSRDGSWHRGMKILCRLSGVRIPGIELKTRDIPVTQISKVDTRFRAPKFRRSR